MSKRDYKSYNVLGEELAQEGIYGESEYTKVHEVDIEATNEAKSDTNSIWQTPVIDISQDAVLVDEVGKEQKNSQGEVGLQPKKRINLGKTLTKGKKGEENFHQTLTRGNLKMDYKSQMNNEMKQSDEAADAHDHIDKNKGETINRDIDKDKVINRNIDKNREEAVNKNIDIGDKINNSKDVKMNEDQETVDMTFLGYKNYYQTKERSKLVKWSIRLAKFIIIMMLLPLITVIASTAVLFIGGFLTAIILPIGTGVVILGTICFMSTQVNASLIALGISASITAISLGGILFVLFCMLMKWMIGLFKRYKKPRNQSMKKEER